MNKYTIFCTPEQTRKALGTPIEHARVIDTIEGRSIRIPEDTGDFYICPAAEQMMGWLEEQDIFVNFSHTSLGYKSWIKRLSDNKLLSESLGFVSSREETIIAAIDVALEYLIQNNE